MNTSPLFIEDYERDDIEQCVKLAQTFKDRFAPTARDIIKHAEQLGLSSHIAPIAIASECLLLAAYLYPCDRQAFLDRAAMAFDHAQKNSPTTGVQ